MKSYCVSVTQRGLVTLPSEVRRLLGVSLRGVVVFQVEDGKVRVVAPEMTLEEAFGSAPSLHPIDDLERVLDQAKEAKAADAVRELQRNA